MKGADEESRGYEGLTPEDVALLHALMAAAQVQTDLLRTAMVAEPGKGGGDVLVALQALSDVTGCAFTTLEVEAKRRGLV